MHKQNGKANSGLSARRSARAAPPVTVLHVDDDPNDTELLRAAFSKARLPLIIHNAEDGEQAIAYLNGQGSYANRQKYQLPALVLLDLKLPGATGFEILEWVRTHPEFANLPVVVLSGSELKADVQQAYAGGADSYLIKPMAFDGLVSLVKDISSTWLSA